MMENPKAARAAADGKAPLQYLDPVMDEDIAYVMEHGALKYGLRNYRDTPMKASVYVGAMRRHLKAWATGEDLDPDSGRPHLAHLVACAVVIEAAREAGTYVDDRTVKASTPLSDRVHIDGDQQAKAGGGSALPWVAIRAVPGEPYVVDCCGSVLTENAVDAAPLGAIFRRFSDATSGAAGKAQCCCGSYCIVDNACGDNEDCTGAVKR